MKLKELSANTRLSRSWRAFAGQYAYKHIQGDFFRSDVVVAQYRKWILTMELESTFSRGAPTVSTSINVPYVTADGFQFIICRKDIGTKLLERAGRKGMRIGEAAFDKVFYARADNEGRLGELLSNIDLRKQILLKPSIELSARRSYNEGPRNIYVLKLSCKGKIYDSDTLTQFFKIIQTMLDRLCAIGAAYDCEPGIGQGEV